MVGVCIALLVLLIYIEWRRQPPPPKAKLGYVQDPDVDWAWFTASYTYNDEYDCMVRQAPLDPSAAVREYAVRPKRGRGFGATRLAARLMAAYVHNGCHTTALSESDVRVLRDDVLAEVVPALRELEPEDYADMRHSASRMSDFGARRKRAIDPSNDYASSAVIELVVRRYLGESDAGMIRVHDHTYIVPLLLPTDKEL